MFTNILTMGQVLGWIRSQSCMQMATYAKGRNAACAHKAIFYQIVDELGKIEAAMHNVLRGLYFPYRLASRVISPLASRTSLGATAILTKFWRKGRFFKRPCFGTH